MRRDGGPDGHQPVWGTIRFRVTALAAISFGVVLVLTGITLVVFQRRTLIESLDESLVQQADAIAVLASDGPIPDLLVPAGDDDLGAQLVDSTGQVLAASANLAGEPSISGPTPEMSGDTIRSVDGIAGDGTDHRLLSRPVDGVDGTVVVLHVATPLDDIDDASQVLMGLLMVAVPSVTALLAALVWGLVGRTLRPVEAIRTEVAGIGGTELDHRVPDPGGQDEIARLARTMNQMLDRVESATRRQQQFVADASHELRTPLTRMRAELEVDLAHPDEAEFVSTHRSLLEETESLSGLVEDLLLLARVDAGAAVVRGRLVDIDDLVLDEVARLGVDHGIQIETGELSGARVQGDPEQLRRVVRNLIDNAARHASSTVALGLGEEGDVVRLTVDDDGPGIPSDERERVFERFTRLDDARDAEQGGSGLGLAISREIVDRHGGEITVTESPIGGTRVVVTLPGGLAG